ncbi:hypothetical protein TcasGA2_TC033751 [Tribolium castaneum]|uniref:Uncharacterized protein n=1 Tax=Tribolium castaneum TaxID=7070 RepID=A0A139WF20_TRICA|nr:hypothetical protein TcasGA2_TC033751 [Tribolium castaneum]
MSFLATLDSNTWQVSPEASQREMKFVMISAQGLENQAGCVMAAGYDRCGCVAPAGVATVAAGLLHRTPTTGVSAHCRSSHAALNSTKHIYHLPSS